MFKKCNYEVVQQVLSSYATKAAHTAAHRHTNDKSGNGPTSGDTHLQSRVYKSDLREISENFYCQWQFTINHVASHFCFCF